VSRGALTLVSQVQLRGEGFASKIQGRPKPPDDPKVLCHFIRQPRCMLSHLHCMFSGMHVGMGDLELTDFQELHSERHQQQPQPAS
jgi:hypothetical protein